MNGPSEKDRELDAYLRGDSPLSKAYNEDARELPPAHVDAQILAEAHRAGAGAKKRLARSPFSGSWMVPASVTAVIVLAVSVVVLLPEGKPGYERQRDVSGESVAPTPAPSDSGRVEEYEAKQAPAATYAAPPPKAGESSEAPSTEPLPPASRRAPAEQPATSQELESIMQQEHAPAAPAARPDYAQPTDSPRKRARAQGGIGTLSDEAQAGKAEAAARTEAQVLLERVETLIGRGELDAARELLAQFRRDHPQVEVPQRILDALQGSSN